ncbi:MAG: hypothetical protein KAV87_47320, partial [Desulfobacteraceae bacterium]|nr:hypothetical protein [Desulfobacteraceae bacterium]
MGILAAGQLRGPDYFILIGYFALMLGIGAYFYRHMKGMKDYFSGGNKIPWWLSGVSFYMASFSAFVFVSFSALAYNHGWVAVTLVWICATGTLTGVLFFSKRWRRARIDSPVEYLETRYSPTVRQLFAWQGLLVRIFDDTFKLVAIGAVVSKAFNVNLVAAMVCSGLIMLAYTMMGGLWAVAVTDFIQFIILTMAVLALVPLAMHEVGGVSNFIANSPEGFFNLITPDYNSVYLISSIILYMLCYSSVNWALIQRYYCVPKERDTYKVGALVIVLQLLGPPLILIPAMAARQFLPGITDDIQVFPSLCLYLLPVGMVGLVVAAMFSATLSMLSGDYNVCASVLTNDVYRRLIRPNASQKEYVVAGRLLTLLIGSIVITVAIMMSKISGEGLVRAMFKLFGIATAPVAIPMLLGLLFKKVTNRGAISGFVAGLTVGILVFKFFPDETTFMNLAWKIENVLLLSTTLVSLVVVLTVSHLFPPKPEETERVDGLFARLATPIGELPQDTAPTGMSDSFSPFRIVGICVMIIGAMMGCILPFVAKGMPFMLVLCFAITAFLLGAVMAFCTGSKKQPL